VNKFNPAMRSTVENYINALEIEHKQLELAYGELFKELGYMFLTDNANHGNNKSVFVDYNSQIHSALEEISKLNSKKNTEAHMDKIKHTLDDLEKQINEIRTKFNKYKIKANKKSATSKIAPLSESRSQQSSTLIKRKQIENTKEPQEYQNNRIKNDFDDSNSNYDDEEISEYDDSRTAVSSLPSQMKSNNNIIKLTVEVLLDNGHVRVENISVNKTCILRDLKKVIYDREKSRFKTYPKLDDFILVYNGNDLDNEELTLDDYQIKDKSVIAYEKF
jgi:hypothetical protein